MLAEWHIDPVQITTTWTDEMLMVMLDKLIERKERFNSMLHSASKGEHRVVSDETLFNSLGSKLKVVQ